MTMPCKSLRPRSCFCGFLLALLLAVSAVAAEDRLFIAADRSFAMTVPEGWSFDPQRIEKNFSLKTGKGEVVLIRYFDGITDIDEIFQPTLKRLTENVLAEPKLASGPINGSLDRWQRRIVFYTGVLGDRKLVAGGTGAAVVLRDGGVGFVALIVAGNEARYKDMLAETTKMFSSIRPPASGETGTLAVAPPPELRVGPGGELVLDLDLAAGWENHEPGRRYGRPVVAIVNSSRHGASMIVMSFAGYKLSLEEMRKIVRKTVEGGLRNASALPAEASMQTAAGKPIELAFFDGVTPGGKDIPMRAIAALAEGAQGYTALVVYVPAANADAAKSDVMRMAASIR